MNPHPAQQPIENQHPRGSGPQRELANDVALLYSWAKIENAHYRDFSRPPKTHSHRPAQIAEQAHEVPGERVESSGSSNQDAASSVAVQASPTPAHTPGDGPGPLLLTGLSPEKVDVRNTSDFFGTVTGLSRLASASFYAYCDTGNAGWAT